MRKPVVIDIETKFSFREQPDTKKLGVSVAGLYDYASETYLFCKESELQTYFTYLEHASIIIGFNINSFDMVVLEAYYPGKLRELKTFDMLEYVRAKTGTRYALNDLLRETLNKKKSGHGLHALTLYREGKIKELAKYCLDDVRLTKELFEYGVKYKEIFYPSLYGKTSLTVEWKEKLHESHSAPKNVSLTLPF
jgi:DEAD/DEAH box helicase domain-containing protein